jgi:hypothetical protein
MLERCCYEERRINSNSTVNVVVLCVVLIENLTVVCRFGT